MRVIMDTELEQLVCSVCFDGLVARSGEWCGVSQRMAVPWRRRRSVKPVDASGHAEGVEVQGR